MHRVIKRNGKREDFNKSKIVRAIEMAMLESAEGVDKALCTEIADNVDQKLSGADEVTIEDIQDAIENFLMESPRKDLAKIYILYRYERSKARIKDDKKIYKLLDDNFISNYKHIASPLKQYGNFVYYRTYSRWLEDQNRREYWHETVRRAVEYNCSLSPTSKEEAQKLFHNIFSLKQFLSGRTFWVGHTKVSEQYPIANYNCAFEIIDNFESFKDLFYLLMVGAGVGVRLLKSDIEKLPSLRTDFEIIHKFYSPVKKEEREDNTSLRFSHGNSAEIIVGDSKEGWSDSLEYFFRLIYTNGYSKIKTIILNYNNVRSKGEKLKTFGGTSSGHESIKNMFNKIEWVIRKRAVESNNLKIKLKPIDCLDIVNIIGENVVVGGVRRTAEIALIDPDDTESIEAKNNLYKNIDGQWIVNSELFHRQMSNNSIYYTKKPDREKLHWQIEQMRYSGEPAWVNAGAGEKRRPNMNGVNPCAEILLDDKGLCNLTTVNVFAFVNEDNTLDKDGLLEAQKLSVRAGYRMTTIELELPEWNAVQKRDRLLGCSLTGWQDMVNALNLSIDEQKKLLRELKQTAKDEAARYAQTLGGQIPLLVTTIKPEGTLSQLPTVSNGVHYSHSPYYIRRVRINSHDPLVKVCEELNYPTFPEVGQSEENCTTRVVEFPVKAPFGKTKSDVSAIEQLETYKMFMEEYVEHNCSITVHVRNNEWDDVEEWIWNNWDDVVAVSFISLDDNFYKLLPYETISEDEYNRRVSEMKPFTPHLLTKYEQSEIGSDVGNDGCEKGVCPIR